MEHETPSPPENIGDKPSGEKGDKRPADPAQKDDRKKKKTIRQKDVFLPLVEALIGGGIFGTLSEVCDNLGFHKCQIWCFFLSISSVWFALAHLIFRKYRKFWILIWGAFGGVILLQAAAFGLWHFKLLHPPPTAKGEAEYPHFAFSLLNPETAATEIEFTNALLWVTNFDKIPAIPIGTVVFPVVSGKTNLDILLGLRNLGPVITDNARLLIAVDSRLKIEAGGVWEHVLPDTKDFFTDPFAVVTTNISERFVVWIPATIPGDGQKPPKLTVRNIIWHKFGQFGNTPALMGIMAKGNKTPAQAITFKMIFAKVSSDAPTAPFLIFSKITNGVDVFTIPPEFDKYLVR